MAAGAPLRLSLAAPTGKAAAHLTESIGAQVASLPVKDVVREQIPSTVSTLHRLLGSRPDSRHFRHDAGNPLPLDVLVVDEASMIDLEMMVNLLDALPVHARLILLGDKDHCALILPDTLNPVLTRELIHAGITRARNWFSLIESRAGIFEQAVQRRVERRSGLRELLLGGLPVH